VGETPQHVRGPGPGRLTRRRAVGLLGVATAGLAGLGELVRGGRGGGPRTPAPRGPRRLEESYGPGAGEWWEPAAPPGRLPTVVLVHGGYWRAGYDRSLEDAVAADLAGRGFLCWNLDYRSSAEPWPATLGDVAAGYDWLARGALADRVDPARVAVVGHSAGGHLALWLASRGRLPAGAPGAGQPGPRPALVVAQAPVALLAEAARRGLGSGAAAALTGGAPAAVPERYRVADPVALLPTGVPSVLVHGEADDIVPLSQSEGYVAAAVAAGDRSRLVHVPGGHFEHLDPSSVACERLREALAGL